VVQCGKSNSFVEYFSRLLAKAKFSNLFNDSGEQSCPIVALTDTIDASLWPGQAFWRFEWRHAKNKATLWVRFLGFVCNLDQSKNHHQGQIIRMEVVLVDVVTVIQGVCKKMLGNDV
jgi:hypothetical protein